MEGFHIQQKKYICMPMRHGRETLSSLFAVHEKLLLLLLLLIIIMSYDQRFLHGFGLTYPNPKKKRKDKKIKTQKQQN